MSGSRYAPDTISSAPTWHQDAACARVDPEAMYPEGKGAQAGELYAKSFCQQCPVIRECLEDAMRLEGRAGRDNRWGIRAGLTGSQRAGLYRRNPGRWAALRASR
ncbi:WhiB family transcriptional regulator [Streptomyces sp. NPDC052114]|uniref:WhiB family transcriptional regulator n=1 Tax=unclassified Streptomyces TaxID=2593676 RepID=UPI0034394F6F